MDDSGINWLQQPTAPVVHYYSLQDYVPQNPNLQNPITFFVFVGEFETGDVVGLRGSIAELGNWTDEGTVWMNQWSDLHPNLWSVTVNLPFSFDEQHNWGLFEFKYVCVKANGKVIWEPYSTIDGETQLVPRYYYISSGI